jgi:hypothetical protein
LRKFIQRGFLFFYLALFNINSKKEAFEVNLGMGADVAPSVDTPTPAAFNASA